MRLDLYCEQTGQSQAAGGFANGLTAILGGCKFAGDRAEMEGNTILRLRLSYCEGGWARPERKFIMGNGISHVRVIQWVRWWRRVIRGYAD
jgi:hypothetical protein